MGEARGTTEGMETMTQEDVSSNGLRFGHAVCMRHKTGQLITLWFADSEAIADEAVAKLQHYHDQRPDLGNSRDMSTEEAFKRRDDLSRWRLHHPVGDNRSYDVAGFERLSLPFISPAKLAGLGELP